MQRLADTTNGVCSSFLASLDDICFERAFIQRAALEHEHMTDFFFNDTATTEIYTILFVGSADVYKRQNWDRINLASNMRLSFNLNPILIWVPLIYNFSISITPKNNT